MVGALQLTSGIGKLVALLAMGLVFVLWVTSLFLLVSDSIGAGVKVVWFVALTCLAPIAIPVYLVVRSRRHEPATAG